MGQSFRLAGSGPGGDTRALLSVEEVFDRDVEGWRDGERREVKVRVEPDGACEIGHVGWNFDRAGDLGGAGAVRRHNGAPFLSEPEPPRTCT